MRVIHPGWIRIWKIALVFRGGGGEKHPESKARTNNKLIPHMALGQNQSHAALVGGECSNHCDIPTPLVLVLVLRVNNLDKETIINILIIKIAISSIVIGLKKSYFS